MSKKLSQMKRDLKELQAKIEAEEKKQRNSKTSITHRTLLEPFEKIGFKVSIDDEDGIYAFLKDFQVNVINKKGALYYRLDYLDGEEFDQELHVEINDKNIRNLRNIVKKARRIFTLEDEICKNGGEAVCAMLGDLEKARNLFLGYAKKIKEIQKFNLTTKFGGHAA